MRWRIGRRAYRKRAIEAGAQPVPRIPRPGAARPKAAKGPMRRPIRARVGTTWAMFATKEKNRSARGILDPNLARGTAAARAARLENRA